MSTTPSPLRSAKPVSGKCAWVSRRHGVLRINATRYTVVRVRSGFRLINWGSGTVYDVGAHGQFCTCPSFVWDHCPIQAGGDGRCKHIAALRALGLLPESGAENKSA